MGELHLLYLDIKKKCLQEQDCQVLECPCNMFAEATMMFSDEWWVCVITEEFHNVQLEKSPQSQKKKSQFIQDLSVTKGCP